MAGREKRGFQAEHTFSDGRLLTFRRKRTEKRFDAGCFLRNGLLVAWTHRSAFLGSRGLLESALGVIRIAAGATGIVGRQGQFAKGDGEIQLGEDEIAGGLLVAQSGWGCGIHVQRVKQAGRVGNRGYPLNLGRENSVGHIRLIFAMDSMTGASWRRGVNGSGAATCLQVRFFVPPLDLLPSVRANVLERQRPGFAATAAERARCIVLLPEEAYKDDVP